MQKHHMPELDAVRGLAVLAVLLFHMGMLSFGWLGVPVFFTLSGYLITGPLREGQPAAVFWSRRFRRIAPLLYLYLMVNLAICIAQGRDVAAYAGHFLFLSDQMIARGAADQHGHIWHLWSIAVEMQAYALWPLVARHRGAQTALAVAGITYWITAGAPMTLLGSVGFFAIGGLLSRYDIPRVPSPAWLRAIGKAGYSIYLWQMLCIAAAVRFGHPALGLPLSLAVGFASWRIFERGHATICTEPVIFPEPVVLLRPATDSTKNPAPSVDAITTLPVVSF